MCHHIKTSSARRPARMCAVPIRRKQMFKRNEKVKMNAAGKNINT